MALATSLTKESLDEVLPHDRVREGAVGQLPREPMARRFAPHRLRLLPQPFGEEGIGLSRDQESAMDSPHLYLEHARARSSPRAAF
jgi:hypothetical protein